MVIGVPGELVVQLVVLEFRQERALTQRQHMEDLSVLEIQKFIVSHDHALWRVVGVLGVVVQEIVVLEVVQEHAQSHHQHMEDLIVPDLQKNSATHNHVL